LIWFSAGSSSKFPISTDSKKKKIIIDDKEAGKDVDCLILLKQVDDEEPYQKQHASANLSKPVLIYLNI